MKKTITYNYWNYCKNIINIDFYDLESLLKNKVLITDSFQFGEIDYRNTLKEKIEHIHDIMKQYKNITFFRNKRDRLSIFILNKKKLFLNFKAYWKDKQYRKLYHDFNFYKRNFDYRKLFLQWYEKNAGSDVFDHKQRQREKKKALIEYYENLLKENNIEYRKEATQFVWKYDYFIKWSNNRYRLIFDKNLYGIALKKDYTFNILKTCKYTNKINLLKYIK